MVVMKRLQSAEMIYIFKQNGTFILFPIIKSYVFNWALVEIEQGNFVNEHISHKAISFSLTTVEWVDRRHCRKPIATDTKNISRNGF